MINGGGMGQIFIVGLGGMLTLKHLEICGGTCSEGSAVLVSGNMHGQGGRLLALNVLFRNNTVSGSGGAVMVKAGALAHIRSCVFEENKASATDSHSKFRYSSQHILLCFGLLANIVCLEGLVQASRGAALFVGSAEEYPVPLNDSSQCGIKTCVTVVDTAFWRNEASWGGAVYVDDALPHCHHLGGPKFECTTCSFVNNTAWVSWFLELQCRTNRVAAGEQFQATKSWKSELISVVYLHRLMEAPCCWHSSPLAPLRMSK